MTTLPLQWRMPNAPSPFIGRKTELQRLDTINALHQPLTIFSGAPGVGKTATLSYWFHQTKQASINSEVLYFLIKPEMDQKTLYHTILSALGHSNTPPTIENVLDIVDQHNLSIVLDQVEHLDTKFITEFGHNIVEYGRVGRWYFVSQTIYPTLIKHSLNLEGLPKAQLQTLLTHWMNAQPFLQTNPQAILDAAMAETKEHTTPSLWALEQSLWGGGITPTSVIDTLSQEQQQLLWLLSQIFRPLPREFLLHQMDVTPSDLDELEQQKLIVQTPKGICIADTIRDHWPERHYTFETTDTNTALILKTILAMSSSRHPIILLEAIRMSIEHQIYDVLHRLMETHFEQLRRQGHLKDIYVHLCESDDPQLSTWQFRCACYMARFEQATQLKEIVTMDLADATYWLYLLLMQGKYDELISSARGLIKANQHLHTPDVKKHINQIHFTLARALIQQGHLGQALSQLDQVDAKDIWTILNVMFVRLNALIHKGDISQADAVLSKIDQRFEQLTFNDQCHWSNFIVHAHYKRGHHKRAATLADRFYDTPDRLIKGTEWILLAAVWADAGYMEKGTRAIKHARHHFQDAPGMLAMIFNIELAIHIGRGFWHKTQDLLTRFAQLPDDQKSALSVAEHEVIRHKIAWSSGLFFEQTETPSASEHGTINHLLQSTRALSNRLQNKPHEDILPCPDIDNLDLYLQVERTRCTLDIINNHDTHRQIEALLSKATKHHCRRLELEIRSLDMINTWIYCPDQIEHKIGALKQLAIQCDTPRFIELAQCLELFSTQTLHVGALEKWCVHASHSRLGIRLAQAVLGNPENLTALDDVLLAQVQKRFTNTITTHNNNAASRSKLGVNLHTGQLWSVVDGDLKQTNLSPDTISFALLHNIIDQAESVDKETLILKVWPDVRIYHPLQHDNRLRLSVGRLRKFLKAELGDESWIETTDTGYKTNITTRVVHHSE